MKDYDVAGAFEAIENELIASMMKNMDRHKAQEGREGIEWAQWQAEELKSLEKYKRENQKKYKEQFSSINGQIGDMIRASRQKGGMKQETRILQAIRRGYKVWGKNKSPASQAVTAEFFKLNDRKLEALIEATTHDVQKAENAILRMAEDQYRKTIFNAQMYANTGAGTYEKAVDMAAKDMLSAGLNCVQYANRARHTLKDYASMAIQTANKRAYLTGEGEKRQEWGISMVIMNKRGNPCPKCLPFVGKILIDDVWSGGAQSDGPYPLMSAAIAAGLYHPRCKDSHTTYFEGISEPPDEKFTKQDVEDIKTINKQEAERQYAKRQSDKFGRLSKYSLDDDNKRACEAKAKEWCKRVDNGAESVILKNTDSTKEVSDLQSIHKIGKINTELLEKEFGKLRTNKIVITDERVGHIKERHPEDYNLFVEHGKEAVMDPDKIIKDCKNIGTVFMVKELENTNLNVIVRVALETDNKDYKNSIMTFYRIRDKNLKKLIEKNKLLYEKE